MVNSILYFANKVDSIVHKRHARGFSRYFENPDIVVYTYDSGDNKYADIFDTEDYTEIIVDDSMNISSDPSPNINYLRDFEAKHGANSIWRSISADRKLVKRGWTGRYHNDKAPHNREQVLATAEKQLRTIRDLFDKHNFDFTFAQSSANLTAMLAYYLGVDRDIPWLYTGTARVDDQYVLYEGPQNHSQLLIQAKERLESQPSASYSDIVEDYIKRIQVGEPAYYIPSSDMSDKNTETGVSKIFAWMSKLPSALIEYYHIRHGNGPSGKISRLERKYFSAKTRLNATLQNHTVNYDEFDSDQSYVYFPLHAQPERALMLWTRYYQDFPAVIKNIAQSLPVGMELYVNEHPVMKGVRSVSFYDDLRRFPNVRVISPEVSTSRIISNANSVITVSSTAGMESLVSGTPVITLGKPCYGFLDTVQSIDSYAEIPAAIQTATNNRVDIRELKSYIAASFEVGFSQADSDYELDLCGHIEQVI